MMPEFFLCHFLLGFTTFDASFILFIPHSSLFLFELYFQLLNHFIAIDSQICSSDKNINKTLDTILRDCKKGNLFAFEECR